MKVRRQKQSSLLVIWMVSGLMLLGMGVLLAELWQLQGPRKSGFEQVFHNQSVRRVRLPAVRGKIYDAKGKCLADSVPSYCIAIFTEELRAPRSAVANTLELMHEIWVRIGRKPAVSYSDIRQHILLTPHQPLVLYDRLSDAELAKWQAAFGRWSEDRKIPGLKNHDPLRDNHIVIETSELVERATSTAANTLELVYTISERLGKPLEVTLQNIKDHIILRRPLPLMAWKDIDRKTMARWADSCSDLSASDIYYQAARHYPEGGNLVHLIGYTGMAAETNTIGGESIDFDLRGLTGRSGLESRYNKFLEGEPGSRLVQIDASGFLHRDLQVRPPKAGGDLQLTIDANIQRFAKDALAMDIATDLPYTRPIRGAVVVLDPNNGDVLAMVSAPTFDPNRYLRDKDYFNAVQRNTAIPTYHRAVYGQYPPGSTFKPVVALGVLKEHPDYGDTIHECVFPYYVDQEKRRWKKRCWIHPGNHGEISLREALMYSCNCYMYEMAKEVGYGPIRDMAAQFGIGQYAGLFPDLEKPVQKNDPYGFLPAESNNTLDLCNMSIGQGALLASPLQMAMVAATIANGGTLYRPRLVQKWRISPGGEYQKNPTRAIRRIDVPMAALELVRGGMYDVVHHENGTAEKARVPGIKIAGKTGSAQYTKSYDKETKKITYGTQTWMISYAPFDFPRYAVAFLVEDGASGGRTVGPRLSALYQKIFEYDGTLVKEEG